MRLALLLVVALPLLQEAHAPQRSPAERMRAIADAYLDGDLQVALGDTEALLAEAASLGLSERQQAELSYAKGFLIAAQREDSTQLEAADAFESARALAGPGSLRLDATYDAGWVKLAEAERIRQTIPEISGQAGGTPGMPMMPGMPAAPGAAPGAQPEQQEDPLELARESYHGARSTFVERLRADWRDADTRANLELIQRRLKELDEIERQREEQQQQQQEQQDQEGEPQEGDPGEEGERQEGEPDPDSEPSQEEQQPEEQQGEQEEQQPEPEPQEGEQPEESSEQSGGEEREERVLTREEVMRLLDKLAELEEQAKEIQAQLREARRVAVERDW